MKYHLQNYARVKEHININFEKLYIVQNFVVVIVKLLGI